MYTCTCIYAYVFVPTECYAGIDRACAPAPTFLLHNCNTILSDLYICI